MQRDKRSKGEARKKGSLEKLVLEDFLDILLLDELRQHMWLAKQMSPSVPWADEPPPLDRCQTTGAYHQGASSELRQPHVKGYSSLSGRNQYLFGMPGEFHSDQGHNIESSSVLLACRSAVQTLTRFSLALLVFGHENTHRVGFGSTAGLKEGRVTGAEYIKEDFA
ncbi:hypothetical protein MHYP_G00086030 [Metynnis hypsauchen]